jgi:hypothetical protein
VAVAPWPSRFPFKSETSSIGSSSALARWVESVEAIGHSGLDPRGLGEVVKLAASW